MHFHANSYIFPQKSLVFQQKNPFIAVGVLEHAWQSWCKVRFVYAQKSPAFPQKSPIFLQTSPIFPQKNPEFSQKSLTIPSKSNEVEWGGRVRCKSRKRDLHFRTQNSAFPQKRYIFPQQSLIFLSKCVGFDSGD